MLILLFLSNYINAQANSSIPSQAVSFGDTIYVFTNRTHGSTNKKLTFGNEVNENSKLIILQVTINETGEFINNPLNFSDFEAQASKSSLDWLLFVHGDSKTFDQSIKRGFDIQKSHQINTIVFSWPSRDLDLHGLKNLKNSRRNILKSTDHFNELLTYMQSFKKTILASKKDLKLSLFIHSLGNLYLKNLFNKEQENDIVFENVILNSAAVNNKLHKEWVENINFQERIYITNNRSDFNLKGLHIFSKSSNQLGEKIKIANAKNALYINFSKAVGFRFPTGSTHTYFIGKVPSKSKNIRNFYFDAFHGKKINLFDESRFIKMNKEVGYNIIF